MRPEATDPAADHRTMVERRNEAIEEARTRVASYPQPVRDQFEMLLAAGQDGQRVQEDHNFWIDQNSLHFMRRVFLEFGARLTAARNLETAEDIVYLEPDQIRESLVNGGFIRHDPVGASRRPGLVTVSQKGDYGFGH